MPSTRKRRDRSSKSSTKEQSKKKTKVAKKSKGKENTRQKEAQPHKGAGNKPAAKRTSQEDPKPKEVVLYDDSDLNNRIPNGFEMYAIWSHDDKFHPVTILESRSHDRKVGDKKSSKEYDFTLHPFQYYVNYYEFDRRMDQWVNREQMRLEKELVGIEDESNYFLKDDVEPDEDDEHGHSHSDHGAHEEATKVKNLNSIVFGKHEMEAWYFSPFPAEYGRHTKLFFCEFCLKFFGFQDELHRHSKKCTLRHPPGHEIYRSKEQNTTISAFEVDGAKERVYCENLCLIAKLFLDHKTLFYDTKIFLFYIICEMDEDGFHIVGYFSKEKDPDHSNNLACILTLPCHQRKGYGRFLISLSYGLSKLEKKAGTPEKPLSDLGKVSYESYWSEAIVNFLKDHDPEEPISIDDMSKATGIIEGDLFHALELLNVLKYEQGEHIFEVTDSLISKFSKKDQVAPERVHVRPCKVELIHWTPYITAREAKRPRNR